ncbi:MAG: hypothetical protein JO053_04240 [Acidobacteria bacterium]|nr:hypothetical protein [Acidobacteriota bacterium]
MTELDQVWSQMLYQASRRSAELGRLDVAEYLRLKASNDAIRAAGANWLFDSVTEIAAARMRLYPLLKVDRDEPYDFKVGTSNMRGAVMNIRHGIRCLTVEAGWARLPGDGIMRHSALAHARISHFGMPRKTVDLRLIHGEGLPVWLDDKANSLHPAAIEEHFDLLLTS